MIYAERGSAAAAGGWAQQTRARAREAGAAPNPVAAREAREEAEAAQRVILSDPFETKRTANLEAVIWAPTDNNWVEVGVSLIAEATGEARSFGLVSDRYHGVGRRRELERGQPEPHGLRVARSRREVGRCGSIPRSEHGKAPPQFRIRLRSGVPHLSHLSGRSSSSSCRRSS